MNDRCPNMMLQRIPGTSPWEMECTSCGRRWPYGQAPAYGCTHTLPASTTPGPGDVLDTVEALRQLEGHKVKIETRYISGVYREIGTIVRDDRVPHLERYLICKRRQSLVLHPSAGMRLISATPPVAPSATVEP